MKQRLLVYPSSRTLKIVREEMEKFNTTLDMYAPKEIVFSVDVISEDFEDEPKFCIKTKIGNKVFYQFDTTDEIVRDMLYARLI